MNIGQYCNKQVVTATADISAKEAAVIMRTQHVGNIIIVEPTENGHRPIGIVTDRDLVVEVIAQEVALDTISMTDLMVTDLITAPEEADLMETISVMRRNGIRRIPVINQQGDLSGILALDDILEIINEQMTNLVKLIRREFEEEELLHT